MSRQPHWPTGLVVLAGFELVLLWALAVGLLFWVLS